jgi:hypothetical protein
MTPDEAVAELTTKNHGWSKQTLEVWRNAGFHCEYCGTCLLTTSDVYFRGGHLDHIVPHGGDNVQNLALACAACNFLKRGSDPKEKAPSQAIRAVLIDAAKGIINARRASAKRRLEAAIPLIKVLMAADDTVCPEIAKR